MDHDNDSNKATEKKNSLALRRFFREMILHYVALIATKHIFCVAVPFQLLMVNWQV